MGLVLEAGEALSVRSADVHRRTIPLAPFLFWKGVGKRGVQGHIPCTPARKGQSPFLDIPQQRIKDTTTFSAKPSRGESGRRRGGAPSEYCPVT